MDRENYKKDWEQSFVFKKAMAAEAIKRGLEVQPEHIVNEEDEQGYITKTDKDDEVSAMLRNGSSLTGIHKKSSGEVNGDIISPDEE